MVANYTNIDFSVPTNWDFKLLEKMDTTNVVEIYGKLNRDIIGGVRASMIIPHIKKSTMKRYVRKVHECGLQFNYLLNASCLNNIEWTRSGQKRIRKFFDWLTEMEVDVVTVAVPYLLQLIKKCYPNFKVNVSVVAGVNDPIKAKFWQDLGAEQITLHNIDVNRNFELLTKIRNAVQCRLQLIANIQCLHKCPLNRYHYNLCSHASQTIQANNGFYIDYCSLSCRYMKLSKLWKLISSCWIRPEDLLYYKQLGIDRIKLLDRAMKTKFILRVIDAYTNGNYEGNLLDLLPFDINKYAVSSMRYLWRKFRSMFHPTKVNIFKLYRANSLLSDIPVYLDNKKLDGFIDFFINGNCNENCEECGYCHSIADKALHVDEDCRQKNLQTYQALLDDIIDGSLFYIN